LVLASPAATLAQAADVRAGATEVSTDDPETETPPMAAIEAVASPDPAVADPEPEAEPETEPEPVEMADDDGFGSPVSVVEDADGQPSVSDTAREDADGPVVTPIDEHRIAPPDPMAAEDALPAAEDGA
jgi:hypothetical protein